MNSGMVRLGSMLLSRFPRWRRGIGRGSAGAQRGRGQVMFIGWDDLAAFVVGVIMAGALARANNNAQQNRRGGVAYQQVSPLMTILLSLDVNDHHEKIYGGLCLSWRRQLFTGRKNVADNAYAADVRSDACVASTTTPPARTAVRAAQCRGGVVRGYVWRILVSSFICRSMRCRLREERRARGAQWNCRNAGVVRRQNAATLYTAFSIIYRWDRNASYKHVAYIFGLSNKARSPSQRLRSTTPAREQADRVFCLLAALRTRR